MRHTGLYFTERDEHLDLFTTDKHEAGPHHRRHGLEGRADRRLARLLRGPDPHRAERAGDPHLPADPPDAALAEGQGRRDPVADRRDRQRLGLARRHRRRARRGADLLHDDPRHPARRGGAGPGRGLLRGGRAAARGPGPRGRSCGAGSPRSCAAPRSRWRSSSGSGRSDERDAASSTCARTSRCSTGRRLVYLDSAATSQKPRQVIEAIDSYYRHSNANIHRGVYALAREATDLFEGARERVAAFVGWDTATTIFTRNATEAINLVAYAWGREHVGRGRRGAHHPHGAPLQHRALAAALRGARRDAALPVRVRRAASSRSTSSTRCSPSGRVKLVAVAHVSNVLGTINPVEEIARARAGRRRRDAGRRRAGRAADAGRRGRDRRRLLRLDRPQGARARPASACCTAAASCSSRCGRSSAAAT